MLKFWQKIKSDLPVMSRGSGLPQKFKVMSEGRAGLKKVQSRGVPGGGMVPEQFEWHIIYMVTGNMIKSAVIWQEEVHILTTSPPIICWIYLLSFVR